MKPRHLRTRDLPRLILASVAIGATAALGVWLFKQAIGLAEWLAFGWRGDTWEVVSAPVVLLAPVLGGLVVGVLLHLFRVPEEPGHGVTEVIEAATLDVEEFPHRQVPIKVSAAALSLGSGASLGPEDPAVEIGGGIAETLGRSLGVPRDALRALIAAGAAGGICAAFHAPFGAVLFTVEVLAVRILSRTALLVVTSSATAYLVTSTVAPEPPLHVPQYTLQTMPGLVLCMALGLLAGGLAAAHIRFIYWVQRSFHRWRLPPRWLKPAIGGLMLGAVGVFLPQLLGIGYGTIEALVAGEVVLLYLLVLLLFGKMALMAVSFGSGFPGGFFAPSFFIGATLGAACGVIAGTWLLPGSADEPAAFAVVGMTATLAAMVHAPFTAVFVVRSITGGYALLPFLIAACLASYWTAISLERRSLYTYVLNGPGKHRRPRSDAPDFGEQADADANASRRRGRRRGS